MDEILRIFVECKGIVVILFAVSFVISFIVVVVITEFAMTYELAMRDYLAAKGGEK